MVGLDAVKASNARIASTIAPGLVALFVGGTNGIGEATLLQLVKDTVRPRIYFTGRSQEAADRIKSQCQSFNKDGEYIFIKADTSLIKAVDEICEEIQNKEEHINLLCLSTGTLVFGTKTDEDLHYALALCYYSRIRFIFNLLPLLQKAKGLRRVVSVHTGTKEGAVNVDDFQRLKGTAGFKEARGHAASMLTLSMEYLAKQAPNVSFIHDYPGFVKTGINRGTTGIFRVVLKAVQIILGPFRYIPTEECGERHLFLATSGAFPAASTRASEEEESGEEVPLAQGLRAAKGSDGKTASGMYIVDEACESGGAEVVTLLQTLRSQGVTEKLVAHTKEQFKRITGVEGLS